MYTITDDFSHTVEYEPLGKLWWVSSASHAQNGGSMTPFVYNGKLRFTTSVGSSGAHIYSWITFWPFVDPNNAMGDYRVTIDFSDAYFETGSGLCLRMNKSTDGKVQVHREKNNSDVERFMAMFQDYGEDPVYYTYNSSLTSGKLRIQRIGSTTYAYFYNGSQWISLGTMNLTTRPSDGTIELYAYSYSTGGGFGSVYVDNFVFEVENPTLYKISGAVNPVDDKIIYLVWQPTEDWMEIADYTTSNSGTGDFEFSDIWTNSYTFDVIAVGDSGEQDQIYNEVTPVEMDIPYESPPSYPDSYTKLLIHSDHADNSTTFTDSSFFEHVITRHGSVVHDTAQKKFCNSSIYIPNDGYLTCADSDDWYLGNTYTLETWLRTSSVPDNRRKIFYHYSDANAFFGLFFSDSQLRWYVKKQYNQYVALDCNEVNLFQNNQWYHIAVTCDNRVARLYVNGIYKVKHEAMTDCQNYGSVLQILPEEDVSAWLDEIRISKDIARWTTETSFTPPTAPYWYTCS